VALALTASTLACAKQAGQAVVAAVGQPVAGLVLSLAVTEALAASRLVVVAVAVAVAEYQQQATQAAWAVTAATDCF
jgi:hypothetical protein